MAESQPIRVLIVDDHQVLRIGLGTFLENYDDVILVGEAANGQEAVNLSSRLQPDVVLMDLSMPVMDGMTATTLITRNLPQTRVIILTSTFSDEKKPEAFKAGAAAFLHKTVSSDILIKTIRNLFQ